MQFLLFFIFQYLGTSSPLRAHSFMNEPSFIQHFRIRLPDFLQTFVDFSTLVDYIKIRKGQGIRHRMTCKVYMGSGLLISVQKQKALCTCNIFLRIMSSAFVLLKCKRCFFLLCTNVFIFRFKDNILLQC